MLCITENIVKPAAEIPVKIKNFLSFPFVLLLLTSTVKAIPKTQKAAIAGRKNSPLIHPKIIPAISTMKIAISIKKVPKIIFFMKNLRMLSYLNLFFHVSQKFLP